MTKPNNMFVKKDRQAAQGAIVHRCYQRIIALNAGVSRPTAVCDRNMRGALPSGTFAWHRATLLYAASRCDSNLPEGLGVSQSADYYGMICQPTAESPTSKYSGRALGGTSKISGTLLLPPSAGSKSSMLRSPC